jgi:hypothetical protein
MNKTLVIVLAIIGSGSLLLCCGCGGLFGLGVGVYAVEGNQVRDRLRSNRVLKEHVGDIRSLEHQLSETLTSDEDCYFFRVEGSKASGTITVVDEFELDLQNLDATLQLDSGEKIRLTSPYVSDDVHSEVEAFLESQRKSRAARESNPKAEREPAADGDANPERDSDAQEVEL